MKREKDDTISNLFDDTSINLTLGRNRTNKLNINVSHKQRHGSNDIDTEIT